SDPVAIKIACGLPSDSLMIYAPRFTPSYALVAVFTNVGTPCLVKTNDVGLFVVSNAILQAAFVSFPSAGRITERLGIALSDGSCSTGSCVGPSSPTAIESCVNTYVTGAFIIADRRIAGLT